MGERVRTMGGSAPVIIGSLLSLRNGECLVRTTQPNSFQLFVVVASLEWFMKERSVARCDSQSKNSAINLSRLVVQPQRKLLVVGTKV